MTTLTAPRQTAMPPEGVTSLPPERIQRLERRLTVVVTTLPFIGFLIAIPLLWGWGITMTDALLALGFYVFTGLGVTIGFHRMFTHRAFDAPRAVKIAFAIAGSMALQGPVIRWVADHRRHHAFTDKPGDPHSPHLEEAEGVKGVFVGLWHSHIGWLFDRETTKISRFAPDLIKDKDIRKVDSLFPVWAFTSFLLPGVLGGLITMSWRGALTAYIWAGLVRIFFLHHVTWSINSICHFYGKRPFVSSDFSTNNWLLSLVSFGEAWHNNHHAFPTSAKHGLLKGQFDPSAMVISAMAKLGLARNVHVPSPDQLEAKRAS